MTAPYSVTAPTGVTIQPGASGTFQIVNSGSRPIAVRGELGRVTVTAVRFPAASHATPTTFSQPWVTISPASFQLAPGHAQIVHIAAPHVPAGAQGTHELDVIWAIRLPATAPGIHATGGVATVVTIPLPGTATPVTSHALAAPHAAPVAHGGISAALLAAVLFAVMCLIVVVLSVRHRIRVRRSHG